MAKLKVFGVNYDGRTRRIVATTTQKKAAELCGMNLYQFRMFASETGNKVECELALKEPEIVWSQEYKPNAEYIRVQK